MPIDPNLIALYSQSLQALGRSVEKTNDRNFKVRMENDYLMSAFSTMARQRAALGNPIDNETLAKFNSGSIGAKRGILTQESAMMDTAMKQAQQQQLVEFMKRFGNSQGTIPQRIGSAAEAAPGAVTSQMAIETIRAAADESEEGGEPEIFKVKETGKVFVKTKEGKLHDAGYEHQPGEVVKPIIDPESGEKIGWSVMTGRGTARFIKKPQGVNIEEKMLDAELDRINSLLRTFEIDAEKARELTEAAFKKFKVSGEQKQDEAVSSGSLPEPKTKADYDNIPSGTRYKHPDGSTRTKP